MDNMPDIQTLFIEVPGRLSVWGLLIVISKIENHLIYSKHSAHKLRTVNCLL